MQAAALPDLVWQAADSVVKAVSTGILVRLASQCPDCEPVLHCAVCPDCICNNGEARSSSTALARRPEPNTSPLFIFVLGAVVGASLAWWLLSSGKSEERETWRRNPSGARVLARGILRTG